jgi:hypothetical protein
MESTMSGHVGTAALMKRLTLDFAAILIGYNIPREDARRVAAKAVETVRVYYAASGAVLRLTRL